MVNPLALLQLADVRLAISQSNLWIVWGKEGNSENLRALLADWSDVQLWMGRCTTSSGEWCVVFFREEEQLCSVLRFEQPCREGRGLVLERADNAATVWCYQSITLGALLGSDVGARALLQRLNQWCIAPYVAEDLAGYDLAQARIIWTWSNGGRFPMALLCFPHKEFEDGPSGEFPVLIPAAWG